MLHYFSVFSLVLDLDFILAHFLGSLLSGSAMFACIFFARFLCRKYLELY